MGGLPALSRLQAHFLKAEVGLRPRTPGPKGTWPGVELQAKVRLRHEAARAALEVSGSGTLRWRLRTACLRGPCGWPYVRLAGGAGESGCKEKPGLAT